MPMNKFIFDGVNKLFIARSGVTSFDVQIDLYSDWKEVLLESDNLKYLPALRTIGGDPISVSRSLGDTYFLLNGWKIRPYEGEDHRLQIDGNLFTEDGTSAVVPTTGNTNVLVEMFVSNLVDSTVAQLEITNLQYLLESLRGSHQGSGSIYYVDTILGDDATNNGLSPEGAFATINRAVTQAQNGRGDVIFLIEKAGLTGTIIHQENVVLNKDNLSLRGPGGSVILTPSGDQTAIFVSGDDIFVGGFTVSSTGNAHLIYAINSDNLLLQNLILSNALKDSVHVHNSYGLKVKDCDIQSFSEVGIHIHCSGTHPFQEPVLLHNLNIHDGVTGIDLHNSILNQVIISNSYIHDNDVGIRYGTGIEQFTVQEHTILFDNTTDVVGPGTNIFFHQAFDNSGLIEQFKQSQWIHSSGTKAISYQDAITSLVAMANGKIVNSSSGVFDFYDQDNSSIVFTLVESGLQRIRQ